jgi:feruloyl-CoA synthase
MSALAAAAPTPDFQLHTAPGGAQRLRALRQLDPYPATVCGDLVAWATRQPTTTFLAERRDGRWTTLAYGRALDRIRTIGAGLLHAPASPAAPLAILAENSIDHALIALAALYVGVPAAPLSVGYAARTADSRRLHELMRALQPGLIFAPDAAIAARARDAAPDVPVLTTLDDLAGHPRDADIAFDRVGPATIAKIMFTSGSTGTPKGVITTNGMLSANQTQSLLVWPQLARRRPVIVDWLPWSHAMGGNHLFGMILRNGGSLYIDDGRPAPGAFAKTIRNICQLEPTMFLGVPRTFSLLLEALHGDGDLRRAFFARLTVLSNAAAPLPDAHRAQLIELARTHATHEIRVMSSWGMTELGPLATASWGERAADDDTIGTPLPGIEITLVPEDGRREIRIKGPNVTPGYWRDPAATRAAFDDEQFFRTGDAAALKDPADPARGIVFAGRLAENFKLSTGTWVHVGALRMALIERGAPLVEEIVVTGHGRDELGALIFVRPDAAARIAAQPGGSHAELARDGKVRAAIAALLAAHNAVAPASSTRIARAFVVPEPPDRERGEVTDKGSINQRRSVQLRAGFVALVDASEPHPDVVTPRVAVDA